MTIRRHVALFYWNPNNKTLRYNPPVPLTPDITKKIEKAGLTGRGGAGFPVHLKWKAVKKAKADKKYVICNASEREPGVFKDFHILENHADKVLEGITLAMDYIGTKECFINLNAEYEKKLKDKTNPLVEKMKKDGYMIRIFKEQPSYIGGEETALMEAIEGRRTQPRLKPPYPTEAGLYGMPTLIHNVETLYQIALIAEGKYEGKRFYSISGAVKNEGVFELPVEYTIEQVLTESNNIPGDDYFVQAGGGASGVVLNMDQVKTEKCEGTGSIIVYKADENPRKLFLNWLTFYDFESCGKCTPCREGTYQLKKMVEANKEIPWEKMEAILDTLEVTSFCPLGKSVPIPIKSYRDNVLKK